MKFLVDRQLPVALVRWLEAQGTDAIHVLDVALDTTPDADIGTRALNENRIVVSKDEDFFHLANHVGEAGCRLWVRLGNCRTATLVARFTTQLPAIEQVFAAGQRVVELR